ncbi:MAG: serine hydrolase [Proteobacteria bacterium]|nr:MAG: serine hydrolase [Pseudomonadota bacterium]
MKRLAILMLITVAGLAAADLDEIFSPLVGAGEPGLAVMVRQNGRTLFEHGYGVRDLTGGAKIDAATNFRLASFTKQFTAMAVMLLVQDGKLRYDTKLTDIFPDFPEYGRAITVRDLLHHMAGLPDYEDLMGSGWTTDHQIQDTDVLDLLKREKRGKFVPGTNWAYSNSGYVVLGLAVAKISDRPFGDFLRERIFTPLHMDGTIVYLKGKNTVPDRSYGHSKQKGKLVQTDQSSTSATLGDGGIYSNLTDLAKWDDALRKHTLLSEAEMRPALEPARLKDGSVPNWPRGEQNEDNRAPERPVQYGFGWFLDPLQGQPRMWHTGGTMGFRTVIERFTGSGLTVIVLCNRTDLDPEKLALEAVAAAKP